MVIPERDRAEPKGSRFTAWAESLGPGCPKVRQQQTQPVAWAKVKPKQTPLPFKAMLYLGPRPVQGHATAETTSHIEPGPGQSRQPHSTRRHRGAGLRHSRAGPAWFLNVPRSSAQRSCAVAPNSRVVPPLAAHRHLPLCSVACLDPGPYTPASLPSVGNAAVRRGVAVSSSPVQTPAIRVRVRTLRLLRVQGPAPARTHRASMSAAEYFRSTVRTWTKWM
jgi:hypothetical protein